VEKAIVKGVLDLLNPFGKKKKPNKEDKATEDKKDKTKSKSYFQKLKDAAASAAKKGVDALNIFGKKKKPPKEDKEPKGDLGDVPMPEEEAPKEINEPKGDSDDVPMPEEEDPKEINEPKGD
jgi:hypothetical protein